eukprot:SAG31_NODE_5069_length_2761_cov_11.750699_1_plen_56_part_00
MMQQLEAVWQQIFGIHWGRFVGRYREAFTLRNTTRNFQKNYIEAAKQDALIGVDV